MRTTCVVALVASILVFTGCTAINGPNCGDGQWNGFCEEGNCDSCETNGFARGGFSFPSLGFNRLAGGCDSGGCGTDANFSDYKYDCGPMCGAYLDDSQTAGGCGCESCEVGQSYAAGRWNNMFGNSGGMSWPRPFAGAMSGLGQNTNCGSEGGGLIGTCRGLGSVVGCLGCNECGSGGNAIGTNHSNCAGSGAMSNCGPDSCGGLPIPGSRLAGRIKGLFFRPNGSPHPYGGELPHTGSPQDGNGFGGGAAAPAYAYPYYTTRGPRDFLMANPPSIGR